MKRIFFKGFVVFLAILTMLQTLGVYANSAGMDTSFNTGVPVGFDAIVNSLAVQSDKKTIVGGYFTNYQGIAANKVIRLNTDGSRDSSFNPGTEFNSSVNNIVIQSDGKIIVGGNFTKYNGVTANRIIRLNTDGSIDSSFNPGAGFNGDVLSIAIQNDGKIVVLGGFSTYQGVASKNIIRLNTDGTKDSSFNPGAGFDSTNTINMAIQSDGKIIVGGMFTNYNGVTANRIIRLNTDGSIDSSFNIGTGFNDYVRTIAIQSDGKIIAGGGFTNYKGIAVGKIIKLNIDGSIDSSFNTGSGFHSANDVSALMIQNNGKIIVGGYLTSYNGVRGFKNIIRLNTDGSIDSSFNPGAGFNDRIYRMFDLNNDKIIIGGNFTKYNGVAANKVIRLNTGGSIDFSFNIGNGLGDTVYTTKIQNDGKIIAGGNMTAFQGINSNTLMRFHGDGSDDTSFNIGSGFDGFNGTYFAKSIGLQNDGKIIVGGNFTTYQGVSSKNIIRLNSDGSRDDFFNPGAGFDTYGTVNTIAIQGDGKIIAGGGFSSYNGATANKIIRLNTGGAIDTSFNIGNGFNTYVNTIAIQSDGKIIVGGNFTNYNGVTANRIIRLNTDGSIDSSFNSGSGFNTYVHTIAIQSGGKIIVGGNFTNYNGVTANRIIRLNTDGSIDSSFNSGSGFNTPSDVYSITIQNDGKIIVGGMFTTYQGVSSKNIIRLNTDGSIDSSFNPGVGFNGFAVYSVNIKNNGGIVVGGNFTTYNNTPAGSLTQLYGDADVVMIPNSTDTGTVNDAFLDEGYTLEPGGDLIGDLPMSLMATDGTIPVDLSIRNADITMSLEADSQILGSDSTNYDGILAVPVPRDIESVNDTPVIAAFKVGTISESLTIDNGAMTLSIPVPTEEIGQYIQVYNAEDNGVSWYPETTTQVIDKDGVPTVEFTTNSFGDFSITQTTDTIPPTASVIYSTTGATNQDVIATLTGESETLTNINATSYTFTGNGEFTFTFEDTAGNTGAATATVNWIDKTAPTASVIYSTTGATNQDVIATLTGESETLININTTSYTFTGNGEFTFTFEDTAGNTGAATATVNWIDKTPPTASVIYSTTVATNRDVVATLTGASETLININTSSHTFSENGSFVFTFEDVAGNTGAVTATVNWIEGNGGGDIIIKDSCPNGDYSSSYYDGICGSPEISTETTTQIESDTQTISTEMQDAYQWAFNNGITTKTTIEEAAMDKEISRAEIAKMISQYATQIKGQIPNTGTSCVFTDIADVTPDLIPYIEQSCQLGIMGKNSDGSVATSFNPYGLVTRGEFATILSRVIWGNTYDGGEPFYVKHLEALYNNTIITNTDPLLIEMRGYVMLMLQRAEMININ